MPKSQEDWYYRGVDTCTFKPRVLTSAMSFVSAGLLFSVIGFIPNQFVFAGDATWVGDLLYPTYHWSDPENWQPQTVPEDPGDVATFGPSGRTHCTAESGIEIESIVFTEDAKHFSLSIATELFVLQGPGIVNNSGIMQHFIVYPYGYPGHLQNITFVNEASAGDMVHFTVVGSNEGDVYGGALLFEDRSNAGAALINNQATEDSDYAGANFYDSSSAQDATIINEAATYLEEDGGSTWFGDGSSAGHANIVNKGATSGNGEGGVVYFADSSSAGNSTITCEASTGKPYYLYRAAIWFYSDSDGGSARIILHGDGTLFTYFARDSVTVTIGSLEGNGHAVISAGSFEPMLLAVGSNNLSTTFDGLLEELSYEVGSEGALKKIGTGELILTNANTYHGSTTVESGTLLANNRPDNGSATGYGSVFVTAGTFGGAGTVTGPVIVGTGRGAGAYLAPGKTDAKPGTLTIQNKVALKSDATYKVTMDSRIPVADKLSCAAASIREAQISFNDIGGSVIASGTIFTVLESTGTDAIAGSFGNLPDGGTIRVGSNTFQADYQDGDGNDLTLTVVK